MPNRPFSTVDRSLQATEQGAEKSNVTSGILLVVVPYVLLAALWILISDPLAAHLFPDPAKQTIVNMLKGWFFIAFTAGLLALLLPRLIRNLEGAPAAGAKRGMILNPYSRDTAPFAAMVASFRAALAAEISEPLDFQEIPLDLTRFTGAGEMPLATFPEERLGENPVDPGVPVGRPGLPFPPRHLTRPSFHNHPLFFF